MGLASIIRKHRQKEREMRILVLGLDNAGKTTILRRIKGESLRDKTGPTIGFNIFTLDVDRYRLNVWDIGGQKSIRGFWRNYFEATDGVVWVVDSCDVDRLGLSASELLGLLSEQKLAGASLLVLANKQDLSSSASSGEIADALQLSSIKQNWHILPCSAVTGHNLAAGLEWLASDISNRIFIE